MHTEWSNGWGGQEIRILEECKGMAARGHKVSICGCPEGKLRPRAEDAGLTFHPLSMAGPWDVAALWKLARLLRGQSVQVINTHSSVDSWLGGFAARLTGTACVRTRHLSVPVNTSPLNFVYRLPHAVTTTGEGIRAHLIDDYGLDASRVFSLPTGIDTGRYAPADPDPALMAELGLDPSLPVVAIVAILRSWKRHDYFCRMAAELLRRGTKAQFLIVGEGPWRENVEKAVAENGLADHLVMTGYREDVERILPLCSVCVLCSDKGEGVPQAVLQQMSCRRAVVGSDAGDVGQVVRHMETGWLYQPGDIPAMTDAVQTLLADQELRKLLGENGRAMVEKCYSMEAMLDRTEGVYATVLAGMGRNRA